MDVQSSSGNTFLCNLEMSCVMLNAVKQMKEKGDKMKVVVASTNEQEHHISELVDQLYTEIFPKFFPDEKIVELKKLNVLQPQASDQIYNATLKDAFQIISSLQALIAVLDLLYENKYENEYKEMFERNTQNLNDYGYFFPLTFSQFKEADCQKGQFSQFIRPANSYMI